LVWALLLFGPIVGLEPDETGRRIPYAACLASSLALVGYAWAGFGARRTSSSRRVAIGMTLGFIGDLCMAGGLLIPALLTFGAGHVFYQMVARKRLRTWTSGSIAVVVAWIFAGAAIWFWLAGSGERGQRFILGATLVYTAFLAATPGFATALALRNPTAWPIVLGGALFLASDAVIAARMFSPTLFAAIPDWIRPDLVWITYGPAQMLINWGFQRSESAS